MDTATLRRMHPEWDVVDFKPGPQGIGLIALGRDGGIFALDATGSTIGQTAPLAFTDSGAYSYTSLAPEQRKENIPFTAIDVTPDGYVLRNANQRTYTFSYPPPPPRTEAPPVNTTNTQQATDSTVKGDTPNLSGSGALHAVLDPLGLGGLVDGADGALAALNKPGADVNWVTQVWVPGTQQYRDAFPEIAAAQAKNAGGTVTHIPTPAEITTYRSTAQTMVDNGLIPAEFVTKDKISALIGGGVSVDEFQRRVMNGVDQFNHADPADQAAFLAYHPAVDFSHAIGALLDPTLNEAAVNRAIVQGQIGGSAIRSGFGAISADAATRLQQAGLTAGSAGQALEQAAYQNPLTENLAGETGAVTKDTQLGAIAGNAGDQATLDRRKAQRGAAFQGGGGAASGGTGRQGF